MEIVCVRIGNFNGTRTTVDHPHQLSNADCVNVFERSIVHPGVKFEIVFGVSDSTWPLYDLDHGRRVIGYGVFVWDAPLACSLLLPQHS
jgi:hypothetical protein